MRTKLDWVLKHGKHGIFLSVRLTSGHEAFPVFRDQECAQEFLGRDPLMQNSRCEWGCVRVSDEELKALLLSQPDALLAYNPLAQQQRISCIQGAAYLEHGGWVEAEKESCHRAAPPDSPNPGDQ